MRCCWRRTSQSYWGSLFQPPKIRTYSIMFELSLDY